MTSRYVYWDSCNCRLTRSVNWESRNAWMHANPLQSESPIGVQSPTPGRAIRQRFNVLVATVLLASTLPSVLNITLGSYYHAHFSGPSAIVQGRRSGSESGLLLLTSYVSSSLNGPCSLALPIVCLVSIVRRRAVFVPIWFGAIYGLTTALSTGLFWALVVIRNRSTRLSFEGGPIVSVVSGLVVTFASAGFCATAMALTIRFRRHVDSKPSVGRIGSFAYEALPHGIQRISRWLLIIVGLQALAIQPSLYWPSWWKSMLDYGLGTWSQTAAPKPDWGNVIGVVSSAGLVLISVISPIERFASVRWYSVVGLFWLFVLAASFEYHGRNYRAIASPFLDHRWVVSAMIDTARLSAPVLALAGLISFWRCPARAKVRYCTRCGYSCRLLHSRNCPECGSPSSQRADS